MKRIAILGAGISGLATGWFLKKKFKNQIELVFYEQSTRPGGWIQTHHEGGFLFERGPRGFRPFGKGETTLELVKELGLENELVQSNKQAKTRYLWINGKLTPFSFGFLLRQGILGALFHDYRKPVSKLEDESIADFVCRRFNTRIYENVMDPLAKGIFGGDARRLSMRSCFPALWEHEKKAGSVFKGVLKSRNQKRKKKKIASLYTFKNGMETLPNQIASQLDATYHYSHKIHSLNEIDADCIVSALPASTLAKILGLENPILETSTIATVSFGWEQKILKRNGYGFLIPSKEKSEILGVTWDSEIFPEQGDRLGTRVCVMIGKELPESDLLETAEQSLKIYLDVQARPSCSCVSVAKNAIPQYTLHHFKRIHEFREKIPANLHLVGNSYAGVGINDCILHAKNCANDVSFSV